MRRRAFQALLAGVFVLSSCGSAANDGAATPGPDVSTSATEAEALDLTEVHFDVRRDPG